MSLIERERAFADVVTMAQTLLRGKADKGELITPDLIASTVDRVAMLLSDELEIVGREAVIDELIRRSSRSIGRNTTLANGAGHEPWLTADRKRDWQYWRRYAQWMERRLPWKAVDALDTATDDILRELEDPKREGNWDRRGLVVGHVQSGKTGNYTGLICKAADAGYKIIIVLAGMHNNLRSQTQVRLDEGFLGFATMPNVDELPVVGVGQIDSDHSIRPNAATNRSERGDFDKATSRKLGITPEQRPWLFVVKKNKTVLERLIYWVENHAADYRDPSSGRKIVTKLPLLVIDDEADHGSVDTGENVVDENGVPDLEHNPTTINRLIRALLHSFARKAYVGYTATPFANIFIHDKGSTKEHGPDLFPSAFITNLAAPDNYIGPGRVFASNAFGSGDPPLIRRIPEADWAEWMPQGHKSGYMPRHEGEDRLPPSLQEAIRSFVLTCAVRFLRGQGSRHSSMLVHVTRFTAVQHQVTSQVDDYVRHLRGRWLRGIGLEDLEAIMKAEYEGVFVPASQHINEVLPMGPALDMPDWEEVRDVMPTVLEDIRVKEINGTAKDALDYAENEGTGLKVIAIGGDKLARGLTLEGLCTSYFLRTARMYDTLMQMGRWFGYRDGYLDLCRLYTTGEMIEWFGHIADAAEDLRQQFDLMAASGATPREFGLKVRSHSTLTVTSRAKMRTAKPLSLSYSGDLLQTIVFPIRPEENAANLKAGARLIARMGQGGPLAEQRGTRTGRSWQGHLWRNVPASDVTAFLQDYRTHPASIRIVAPLIAGFIDLLAKDGELIRWTVALIGKESEGRPGTIEGHKVTMLTRKRHVDQDDRFAIKALVSPRDETVDATDAQWDAALELTQAAWTADHERHQDGEVPSKPSGVALRRVRGRGHGAVPHERDRGVMTMYLIDPEESGVERLKGSGPVLGWALSFPESPTSRTVSTATYMGNSVLWSSINEWAD